MTSESLMLNVFLFGDRVCHRFEGCVDVLKHAEHGILVGSSWGLLLRVMVIV